MHQFSALSEGQTKVAYLGMWACFRMFVRNLRVCDRDLPNFIPIPPYALGESPSAPSFIPVQSVEEINRASYAGSIVHHIFEKLNSFIRPGLSTQDIDDFIFDQCIFYSVYPSPLGYRGFPKSVCTSINEIACHGIPSKSEILRPGDLISVDVSVFTGFAHGDACRTYVIKEGNNQCNQSETEQIVERANFLCNAARECRDAGIMTCGPHVPYSEIAKAISKTAQKYKCRVVAGIRGHGIGSFFHGLPEIIHSVHELSEAYEKLLMKPGHIFTIEPCITLSVGDFEILNSYVPVAKPTLLDDGWAVVTTDETLTAQFEHMVLITESGHLILT